MEEYRKILGELYLEKNSFFDPSLDSIFFVEKSWGGALKNFLKVIAFDVDRTLNPEGSKNLSEVWVENLPFENNEINELKNFMEKIGKISSRVDATEEEIAEAVNKFGKKLAELNFKIEDYLETSKNAANELGLIPYTSEFEEIKKLGYSIGLNSGAPQEAIKFLCKRLGLLGANSFGSFYEFDEKEKFTGRIFPCLRFKKGEAFDKFLNFYNCKNRFSIFMTDNPISDLAPSSKAGFKISVSDKEEKLSEYFIKLPEVRKKGLRLYGYEGMQIVTHFLKRWDLLNIVYFLRSPQKEKEILKLALSLGEIEREISKGKDLDKNKKEFIRYVEELLSFLSPIYSKSFFGLESYAEKLFTAKDEEKIKSLSSSIYFRLKEKIPELNEEELKRKKFVEKISEMAKEKLECEVNGKYYY